ncbi:MAG: YcxB family protein [Oscillospiraceae bacterium]|nr:YcxB family protein [Oscillospiraceae bacterium]
MASQIRFRANIRHTEKTVEQLYRTTYHVFDKFRILLRLLFGLALIFAAAFLALPTWARVLLLMFGAWFVASGDFPAQIRADRALENRKAALPAMDYAFYNDRMELSGEGAMTIRYKQLTHLVQDESWLYLILARDSVCMIDRESVSPGGAAELMQFLAQKTQLTWRREQGLLSMNLWDLRQILRDRKRK